MGPAAFFTYVLIVVAVCCTAEGSRLIYQNELSQPNELDMMELFIGQEPPAALARPPMLKRADLAQERERDQNKQASGLWFGPRLGRRRRSVDLDRARRPFEQPSLMGKTVYVGQGDPWTVLTFGGKRDSNYSPRLGRNSEEDALINFFDPMLNSYRNPTRSDGSSGGGRDPGNMASNFTPRLGRLAPNDSH